MQQQLRFNYPLRMAPGNLFLFLLFAVCLTVPAFAADNYDLSEIQEKLAQLQAAPVIDESAVSKLELTLDAVNNLTDWQRQIETLQSTLATYASQNETMQQRLTQLQTIEVSPIPKKKSIAAIDVELANAKAQNTEIVEKLSALSAQRQALLIAQMELPERIVKTTEELKAHREFTFSLAKDSVIDRWYSDSIDDEKKAKLSLYTLQQDSMVQRLEVTKLAIQLNERELKHNDLIIESLQQALLSASEKSGQRMIKRAKQLANDLINLPEQVLMHADAVELLASQYDALSINTVKVRQERQQLESIRQQTTQTLALIKEHIEWLKLSPAFSDAIRFQLRQLPIIDTSPETDLVVAAHMQRFNMATRLSSLSDPNVIATNLIAQYQLDKKQAAALTQVLEMRADLLDTLVSDNDQYIAELTRLEALREQVIDEIAAEKSYLREKQIFLQGRSPLWSAWPESIPALFGTNDFRARLEQVFSSVKSKSNVVISFCILSLLIGLLAHRLKQTDRKLSAIYAESIGNVVKDRFRFTSTLILLGLGYAICAISWLYFPFKYATANNLLIDADDLYHISMALLLAMAAWELVIRFSRENGVFITHFQWRYESVTSLRRLLQKYRWILYLLMLLMALAELFAEEAESTAVRLSYMLLASWLALFSVEFVRSPTIRQGLPLNLNSSVGIAIVLAALVLPYLSAIALTAFGYFYAAWITTYYQQAILLALLTGLFIQHYGFRWLRIEQRRLAYQRAKARREELNNQHELDIEEHELDVDEVSEQSVLVLNVVCLVIVLGLLSAVWANTELAFQWMDSVVVWEVLATSGSIDSVDPVTLKEALSSLLLFVVCLFAARNLPGVLELLVLQHLNLSKGAAYATTQLLRYLVILVGLVVGLSTLGLHWSKLQWLVAALGVGLGFGLQEIFANLVSGLILLFERPVRVGDTITINNLTGTVTKINTRATTIQDWDRKEIVVPNKALITDQLINWSLSDGITRIVIPVGVAYGSDVLAVKRHLVEVASENSELLLEPKPIALFNGFGSSSLEFELRAFLDHLDKLATVRDQLNTAVEQRFRQQGIEIALPQLDIRVKALPNDSNVDNSNG
ncbi:mechanosensitive ion channel domain-containing protein [Ferrimonas lipolytica]|uniref:Mechanosensitive ion channel n=1 Tax=Ferrimonas lipolytica TaxID=2724191 RepID=A0A6H1UBZ1_9GAMM|nr:mechanosensitive ion channel domain-containing protein [Ferrimonas lipolytica]QIZ76581.1 mechanosensitive ion channel [Ferrimonas lipolytica]